MDAATRVRPTDQVSDELIEDVAARIWGRGISRRRLLQSGAWAALAVALAGCTQAQLDAIANRPVRRNINSLAPTDAIIVAYETAITAMKALDTSNPSDRRGWTKQAEIHRDFCPHGNWLFLPWHRVYLRYFEDIIRKLSGNESFALPYWNWVTDLVVPDVFKNASSPLYVDPTNRPGANTLLNSAIYNPTNIDHILDEPNFLLFASGAIAAGASQRQGAGQGPLEFGPHNTVHTTVRGFMLTYMSPLDPVFWTHHNVIDLLWVNWNITRGNPNTNDTAWVNRQFTEFCDRDGNPVTATVLESILYPYFTYRYDDPTLGGII